MTFCDQGEEGVPVDVEYYNRTEGEFLEEANGIEEALMNSPEAGLFLAEEERPINLGSNPDLRKLLFTHLGHEPFKETFSGAESVDAESMDKVDIPFTKDLVEMRKLRKIVAYFDQIRREAHGGKVHPITNLNIARTFRPSINDPNFANLTTHCINKRPVVVTDEDGNDAIAIRHVGYLGLTWDHRAFDGSTAVLFLGRIRDNLETWDWELELA